MTGKVAKFTGFYRNERTIAPAATNQFATLQYTCEDADETVVGIHVEIAMNPEGLTDEGSSNVAGYARIVVNRAGNTIPVVVSSQGWADVVTASNLNDEDTGDTWAITPFALGSTLGVLGVTGVGLMGSTGLHLVLSPATKRSLRKGDTVEVEIQYSNSGTGGSQPIQEVVTGTIFIHGD